MTGGLLRAIIEGLLRPRASAGRILASRYGADAAVLMLVLAYLVQAMLQIVLPGARELPEGIDRLPIALHLLNLIVQLAVVGVLAVVIHGVGRAFGGAGTRLQAFVIVSWHTLVTTVLAPIFLIGMAQVGNGEVPPGVLFLMVTGGAIWLWLLAVYTAELHGFRNPWSVLGVMLGVSFLVSSLFVTLMPAP